MGGAWMNDRFSIIFWGIPHTPVPRGWICSDIGSWGCNFAQANIIPQYSELNTYTLNEKILRSRPWVLANPGPHDEEDAGPDQGELDEEGVEVGRRLRHNVAHQVNSPASEVVKLVWRGHLYIQDLIDMLQKLQNHAL